MRKLGDILQIIGAVSGEQCSRALQLQAKIGGKFGELLLGLTSISPRQLAKAVAEQQQLPLVWLDDQPPNPALFKPADMTHYLQWQMLPWRVENGVLWLVSAAPSPQLLQWARKYYATEIALAATSARDIRSNFTRLGHGQLTRDARLGLRRKYPHLSASRILVPHQKRSIIALLIILLTLLLTMPKPSLYALLLLSNLFYLSTLCFKAVLITKWQKMPPKPAPILAEIDASLPKYSILVPLYREPKTVIDKLLKAIAELDYPAHLKQVFLLCEADDIATIDAIKAAQPAEYCAVITVPASLPRTKPKACNYILPMLDGEFVVIFDAEDRPEPLQLRKAVAQFRARPEIACLQAPLNYYNRPENMLTELFAIEYSALFRIQLPALEALDIPIPLGGTSNHIRSKILLDLGGWDAFNVTEDADLGIRLAYFGHKTAILDSITEEEAPLSLRAWLKQRSRWVKGYIQTWLVYSRDPRALKQRLSRSGYYGFQFFVGAPALTFIMAPFFWLACISALLGVWHEALPVGLVLLCNFSLLFGVFSHWHYARVTVRNEGWANMHRAIAIFPLYWLLHSLASFMALWQLLRKPFYWAKTTHGITRVST